jgi:hypothetical protein
MGEKLKQIGLNLATMPSGLSNALMPKSLLH